MLGEDGLIGMYPTSTTYLLIMVSEYLNNAVGVLVITSNLFEHVYGQVTLSEWDFMMMEDINYHLSS